MTALQTLPRVLAIASHPIQYHAPWFRALGERPDINFQVLFVDQPDAVQQGRGFGVAFNWDLPLLQGYTSTFATESLRPLRADGFLQWRLRQPRSLIRHLAPDAVVMTGWHIAPMVQLLFAARAERRPVIMRGEANALRGRSLPARLAHRTLLSQCQHFMPIGRASRAFYASYGIAASSMTDAPYFIDNERFSQASRLLEPQRDELRARWLVPADTVCFLFAGKLEAKKRILDLLEAFRLAVQRSSTRLHLLVVGSGDQMPEARHRVASGSLPVTFAGFLNQTEIPAAYVACDALVLPSDYGETWGLVVNEAMACARPAIVSDRVGCGADLVHDGRTGFRFPFADTDALAQRLVQTAADAEARAEMGRQAQELVMHHYNVAKCAEGTVQSVNAVLGRA